MKSRMLFILVLLLPMLLTACNRAEVTDVQRNPAGGVDVSLTLSEAEVNSALTEALNISANPLLRDPQVDFQPGKIVINGSHGKRDGSGVVSGSVTVEITIVDGKLKANIISATIEGYDVSDGRVARFNEELANIFAKRAERDHNNVKFTAFTITETEVQMTITATRR